MVHINVSKLRGKLAEKGYTKTSMAKTLGIDRNTFTSYLKRPEKMPYNVLSQLADILCDTVSEAKDIFFTE